MRQPFSGTVTKVQMKSFVARDSGRYGAERYDLKLFVEFRDDSGKNYWFYTPTTRQSITTSGPYSVSTVQGNDWIVERDWRSDGALGARGFGAVPVPRVQVGDYIQITAKVKQNSQLWYVKRVDFSLQSEQMVYAARLEKALQHKPPTRIEFPLTPHNQMDKVYSYLPHVPGWHWRICGGPEGLYFADSELKSPSEFLAWFEDAPLEDCHAPK
jgi:hypothetical protein